jgi:hypothetical protein
MTGMRPHVNALFAQAIRDYRHIYLTKAGNALVESHLTPAGVVRAYRLAEMRWVDEHPTLARIGGVAS